MPSTAITRRRFIDCGLRLGLGGAIGAPWLSGCAGDDCVPPIGWAPSVLAPVFYGYQELGPTEGAPAALRVFYPSIEGSPPDAPLLTCLGRYPLVLFLHGQCPQSPPNYQSWFQLPATLARSGFVVAVPDLGWISGQAPWQTNVPQYDLVVDVVDWMRTAWSGRAWLSGSSTLALVGHSYGALLAGRLAVDIPSTAYVSIGGGWAEHPGAPGTWPVASLPVPSLFLYGTNDTYALAPPFWFAVPTPKHQVIFEDGNHWDYLDSSGTTCGEASGPCGLVDALTADLVTVFLSKQMRVVGIPDTLEPPPFTLSGEQMFYAGNHLTSFDLLPQVGCAVTIEWSTPGAGSVALPWP